jgi:hypothetical protein
MTHGVGYLFHRSTGQRHQRGERVAEFVRTPVTYVRTFTEFIESSTRITGIDWSTDFCGDDEVVVEPQFTGSNL